MVCLYALSAAPAAAGAYGGGAVPGGDRLFHWTASFLFRRSRGRTARSSFPVKRTIARIRSLSGQAAKRYTFLQRENPPKNTPRHNRSAHDSRNSVPQNLPFFNTFFEISNYPVSSSKKYEFLQIFSFSSCLFLPISPLSRQGKRSCPSPPAQPPPLPAAAPAGSRRIKIPPSSRRRGVPLFSRLGTAPFYAGPLSQARVRPKMGYPQTCFEVSAENYQTAA